LRTGIVMSTIPDALIAFTAVQIVLGVADIRVDGQPFELRRMVSSLLEENWGGATVIAIGSIISISALVQFFYGVTRGYKERLDIAHFSRDMRWLTHFFAWVGYGARGVILGIIGFFFLKAGLLRSGKHVVNTDKAFDFIGDHVGHLYFIVVAIGTIGYGLFMFIHGWAYDPDRD
jgi:hypothetical protein